MAGFAGAVRAGEMRAVFLGPPGAGKGTQAELLSKRMGLLSLASGDILRQSVRNGDDIGRKAARCMGEGKLVPDALMTEVILQRLEPLRGEDSFILDGFPRTVPQAEALDAWLAGRKQPPIDVAVDFDIAEEKIIQRLAGRRICRACGANYHLQNLPPKREGQCDRCGKGLQIREDDEPATIRKRFLVYYEATEPLLSFYRGQGKLRTVRGDLEIEAQYQAVLGLLKQEQLL